MESITFSQTVYQYTISILPWILVGIVIAYFLEKYLTKKTVKKYLGSAGHRTMITSILLGMISPLSIMSFLPVAKEFIDMGANPGILFGFLIAERAYDLQSFFIISSLFGIKFAVLNAASIFISLYVSTFTLSNHAVRFKVKEAGEQHDFWRRQAKLIIIVIFGIGISALLRTYIPQEQFQHTTGSIAGGIGGGLLTGFVLYLGPIMANYPIAKAFFDLGMSTPGIFAFLTVTPVINIVIISLFGATAGYKTTFKSFAVYGVIALLCTALTIPLLR